MSAGLGPFNPTLGQRRDLQQGCRMAQRRKNSSSASLAKFRHKAAKRTNNPPPKIVAEGTVPRPPEGECRYTDVVFAGLSFDAAAQSELEEYKDMKVKPHLAHIRPGVNPETSPLLTEPQGSQLFTVFALPRIRVSGPNDDGEYQVTMEGVDIYNPVDNSIQSTKADKMTAWCLDAEYDGKTFFLT